MVNTFLIDVDFYTSARLLNYRRLGKQRVESKQLINVLSIVRHICSLLQIEELSDTAPLLTKRQWLRELHTIYLQQSWRLHYDKTINMIMLTAKGSTNQPVGWINHPITAP